MDHKDPVVLQETGENQGIQDSLAPQDPLVLLGQEERLALLDLRGLQDSLERQDLLDLLGKQETQDQQGLRAQLDP